MGISLNFYRKKIKPEATIDDIRFLKVEDAAHIYKNFFWDRNRYEEIENQTIADKLFDLAVNCGASEANVFIQQAVNKIPGISALLIIDGVIGQKTISAINLVDSARLYQNLIFEAYNYYHDIAKHGANKVFLNGWVNRLIQVY